MKKIVSFITAAVIFCFLIQTVSIFADEPCYVYINNQLISFDDATPQIMNSRAMVPFRKTAETLGAVVDWNAATETMTLTKGTRTVVHTLRSNIITVNGEATTFDTPSAVLQSRTMMPVRMLAQALGATVDWDNTSRSVLITTEAASVLSATPSKNLVNNGEAVTINILASSSTERVKLVDVVTNSTVNESVVYTQNNDGTRAFSVQYTPSVSVSEVKTLKVCAGNAVEYSEDAASAKNCMVTVAMDNQPKIINISSNDRSVAKNDYVALSVFTNTAADRVKILNSFKATGTELTTYNLSGDDRVFQTKIKMTEKGECDLYIYVGNADGYEANYETLTIDVGGSGSTSKRSDDDELEIKDIEYDSDAVVGENSIVTITTTYDITKVEIYDSDDKRIVKKNFPSSSSLSNNEKTWKAEFEVESSGRERYEVRAYNDDEDSTTESFSLTGEKYSSSDLAVLSVTQKSSDVKLKEKVKMSAKTTSVVEYIIVKDSSSNEVARVDSGSGSNTITWNFDVVVEKESKNSFTVYAYDSKDNVATKKFTVSLDIADAPEINDIDVKDKTVEEDEEINVTVYTNDAVSKIWIEDENGNKVGRRKTNYDDKDDDEFIWEFSFDAESKKGSYTYTVIAENDDGDQDEMTFKIRVTD